MARAFLILDLQLSVLFCSSLWLLGWGGPPFLNELKLNQLLSRNIFELDLAFDRAPSALLADCKDLSAKLVLTKVETWENNLRNWIQYLRSDKSIFCPELIRIAPALSMGLKFTDDSTIKDLNNTWRQKPEKTDVLSFPAFDPNMIFQGNSSIELGDIIVSIPTAEQQSKDHDHSLENELRWLVSHGLLHLLGWEHSTPQKLKEMLSCQEQLLSIDGSLRSNEETHS